MSTAERPLAGLTGLPDAAELARLANAFFASLPGGASPQAAVGGLPAGLPSAGLPFGAQSSAAALTPDAPGPLPAVPGALGLAQGQGARAAAAPAVVPSGGVPSGGASLGGIPPSVPPQIQAIPQVPSSLDTARGYPGVADPSAFGLPGEHELAGLLAPRHGPAQLAPSAAAPAYYFLDERRPGGAGIHVPGHQHDALQAVPLSARPALDVNLVRRDFPILAERVNGRQLIWLDNAATTQKPQAVMDRIAHFYQHENSNIHRAAHELAARATDAYEAAREKVRAFLGARSTNEVVFVRGATEAINLVAQSWGRANIGKDDEIIVSHLEHHANIVPWQRLCVEKGAKLRVIPVDDCGQVLLEEYGKLLGPRTRLVSFTQVSNALGTVTPARRIVEMAHAAGATVLVDGAQSVSHMAVDVQALDADFFVFSGHKLFGPTGIGVVYGKEALLNDMPPWQGGGNMIRDVTFEHIEYHPAPNRFEAGTGNIADAVGLGAAIDYVSALGMDNIARYEHELLAYATRLLQEVPGLRLVGTAADKASVLSFTLDGYKTEEVGAALNKEGIAVRSGHHCAQPILRRFGLETTVRPSLAFYNTCAEVDVLAAALWRLAGSRRIY